MPLYTRRQTVEAARYLPGQPLPKGLSLNTEGDRPYAFIPGRRGGESKVYDGDWVVEAEPGRFVRVPNGQFTKEFSPATPISGEEAAEPSPALGESPDGVESGS